MMKNILWIVILVIAIGLFGYFYMNRDSDSTGFEVNNILSFTKSSTVSEVMNNKSFEGFGNLIFPVDRDFDGNTRLDDIDDIYVWYNYINDDKTVEIEVFDGLPHGFGLGIGTNAAGWIDNAVKFWESHM